MCPHQPESSAHPKRSDPVSSIALSGSMDVGKMEAAMHDQYSHLSEDTPYLTLDLRRASFIDIPAFQQIIALCCKRTRLGQRTKIQYPTNTTIQKILRIWRFRTALAAACGQPPASVDLKYAEPPISSDPDIARLEVPPYGLPSTVQGVNVAGRTPNFFAFQSFEIQATARPRRIVEDERNRWRDNPLVRSVLDKHLSNTGKYIHSRIIYEAMMNATRHGGASIIQTASFFDLQSMEKNVRRKKHDRKNTFTLTFWDDGESMLKTLKHAIDNNIPIRQTYDNDLNCSYLLKSTSYPHDTDPLIEIFESTYTPDASSKDEELLLAIVFPGLSRNFNLPNEVDEELRSQDPRLARGGMGLHVLLNCVIKIYGGSVSFRTGKFFMNVRSLNPRDLNLVPREYKEDAISLDYWVRIRRAPSSSPEFLGNLVTIRIPLKKTREV